MGYLKAFALMLALMFVATVITIRGLFQWGNPNLNRDFQQMFSFFARHIVGLKFVIENEDRLYLHRPAILTANHQTGLDLAIIGSLCPYGSVMVAKRELLFIPFLGWFFLAAGNIMINRSRSREAKGAITGVIDQLNKKKLNLIMFPEGTRNRGVENTLLPFKKGMFHLAVQGGLPIVPVVCATLKGVAIWEHFELKGGVVCMSVLPPIFPRMDANPSKEVGRLADEVREKMLVELIRLNQKQKTLNT